MNDPQQCPLCGAPNQCGMVSADTGKCWCFDVQIPTSTQARVPESARDKACICQACAGHEPDRQEQPCD